MNLHLGQALKYYIISAIAAAALTFPMVTFFAALFVLPLVPLALVALVANFGFAAILVSMAFGLGDWKWAFHIWLMSIIVWAASAYGLSHWDTVANGMGARREDYWTVFLFPIKYLLHLLFGLQSPIHS